VAAATPVKTAVATVTQQFRNSCITGGSSGNSRSGGAGVAATAIG